MIHLRHLSLSVVILLCATLDCKPAYSREITDELDVKIGQMLMIGFRGLEVTQSHPIVQDIRNRQIGGVIIFDHDVPTSTPLRNIQSPVQVKALTASLQNSSSIPLLIAIDQEGGRVNRLKREFGFPPTVSAQYLGSINNLDTTRKYSEIIAATLAEAGINLNFTPVVDLNTNSDNPILGKLERSFSADPNIVTRHALEVIKTHRRHGILSTIKHFPGHGSSRNDSHKGFVDVTNTWSDSELTPFLKIVKTGETNVVMTAHIFNAKLDPSHPATLSSPIITGILRNKLKYDGVVVSDDMQMEAISVNYSLETAIELAIQAGVDILVFANNSVYEEDIAERAVGIIKKLVLKGNISRERIDQSYRRILHLKSQADFLQRHN